LNANAPADLTPGELVTIAGTTTNPANCANGTFAFGSFAQISPTLGLNNIVVYQLANSSGATGGTAVINSDYGTFDPLQDYPEYPQRKESYSAQLVHLAGQGMSGARLYAGTGTTLAVSNWKLTSWPENATEIQSSPFPLPVLAVDYNDIWHALAPGLNLINRLKGFFLDQSVSSPWIAPGEPTIVSTLSTSSTYGNVMTVWSTSEIPQTVSVPLGAFCQIGANPISVYRMAYPHSTTDRLTGVQTNYSFAMEAGEMAVFACHNSAASFVQNQSFSFTLPSGATKAVFQFINGNYPEALAGYTRAVTCTSSPCTIALDTGWSDTHYLMSYLDANNNVVAADGASDYHRIAKQ
jgi:hypothetical protein